MEKRGSHVCCFFFQAEDGIRDLYVTGVQTCALPISCSRPPRENRGRRKLSASAKMTLSSGPRCCGGLPAAKHAAFFCAIRVQHSLRSSDSVGSSFQKRTLIPLNALMSSAACVTPILQPQSSWRFSVSAYVTPRSTVPIQCDLCSVLTLLKNSQYPLSLPMISRPNVTEFTNSS